MKKIIFLISLLLLIIQLSFSQNEKDRLFDYLPKADELTNWEPGTKPEIYVGDDLYIFINGGAEIYYEYGFNKVVYNEYKDKDENSINVEIYEMKSPESAFGIYSFKTGQTGESLPIGNDAFLQSYYMNFWKGNYLVILTGFDENEATISGIKSIAKIIEQKIKVKGSKPDLVNLLPKENRKNSQVKYLSGLLALFNQYNFGTEDIFGISEAVLGKYNDHQLFIFRYKNDQESLKYFQNAVTKLQKNPDFSELKLTGDYISMFDQKGNLISIKPYKQFVLVILSEQQLETENIFNGIQNHINKVS